MSASQYPKPKHITVLCGGESTEHAVSITSARCVVATLQSADHYVVSVIYITQQNVWYLLPTIADFLKTEPKQLIQQTNTNTLVLPMIGQLSGWQLTNGKTIPVDCVIPMVHGTGGEDGSLQGLLELLKIPYVGCDVLASAISMDKAITKALLMQAKLPVVDSLSVGIDDPSKPSYQDCVKQLGDTLFVKANNLGSSVATYKVRNEAEYNRALQDVFIYSTQALIERAITGREIECAVLGDGRSVMASHPGEIIAHDDFYSYHAKYVMEGGADVIAKADLSTDWVATIQQYACLAFSTLRASGMLRVDFFLDVDDKLYINEVNTIPGFTAISLYPKMWEMSGLALDALLDKLIDSAMYRYHQCHTLQRDFNIV